MLSDSELVKGLQNKCLNNDSENGEIKFHFILKILNELNIIKLDEIKDLDNNLIIKHPQEEIMILYEKDLHNHLQFEDIKILYSLKLMYENLVDLLI